MLGVKGTARRGQAGPSHSSQEPGSEFQHTRGGWQGLGLMKAHRELGAGVRAVEVLGNPWNKVLVPVLLERNESAVSVSGLKGSHCHGTYQAAPQPAFKACYKAPFLREPLHCTG